MKIAQSSYWSTLWKHYTAAPSVALCRVPELEYAASLNARGNFLDHCCGDGYFASLAWKQERIFAGCDISEISIALAEKIGIYGRLDICDASISLPYEAETFDVVFNNSALEHIYDLDSALLEISRVLRPGGILALNVLNHRYFEWWPLDDRSKQVYRDWQPFYHALSIEEWKQRLSKAGLELFDHKGYFDREISQRFAKLDYLFSGYYIRGLNFWYVKMYLRLNSLISSILKRQLEGLDWKTDPDAGAGYFIRAVRSS